MKKKNRNKKFKTFFIVLWCFFAFLIIAGVALQSSFVQTFVIKIIVKKITQEYNLKTNIQRVKFSLPASLSIEGVSVQDNYNNEVIKVNEIQIALTAWLKNFSAPQLKNIYFNGLNISIQKEIGLWNVQPKKNNNLSNSKGFLSALEDCSIENVKMIFKDSLRIIFFEAKNISTLINLNHIRNIKNFTVNNYTLNIQNINKKTSKDTNNLVIKDFEKIYVPKLNTYINKFLNFPVTFSNTNILLEEGNFIYNQTKINNLTIWIKQLYKDSVSLKMNNKIEGSINNKKIIISSLLKLNNTNFKIQNFVLKTPLNNWNIDFNAAWKNDSNFYPQITEMNFGVNESRIHLDECLFFMNEKEKFNQKIFKVNTKINFSSNKLKLNNLFLKDENNVIMNVSNGSFFKLKDSLNFSLNQVILNLDSSLLTLISNKFLDSNYFKNNFFNQLRFVHYKGNVNYNNNKIFTLGELNTNLGKTYQQISFEKKNSKFFIESLIQFDNINLNNYNHNFEKVKAECQLKLELEKSKINFLEVQLNIDTLMCFKNHFEKIKLEISYSNNVLNTMIISQDEKYNFFGNIKTDFGDTQNVVFHTNLNLKKINLNYWINNRTISTLCKGNFIWNKNKEKIYSFLSFKDIMIFKNNEEPISFDDFSIEYSKLKEHQDMSINFQNIGFVKCQGLENFTLLKEYLDNKTFTPQSINPLQISLTESLWKNKNLNLELSLKNLNPFKRIFSENIKHIEDIKLYIDFENLTQKLEASFSTKRFEHSSFNLFNLRSMFKSFSKYEKFEFLCDSISLIQKLVFKNIKTDYLNNENQ